MFISVILRVDVKGFAGVILAGLLYLIFVLDLLISLVLVDLHVNTVLRDNLRQHSNKRLRNDGLRSINLLCFDVV